MCEHHNDRTINRRQALTGGVALAAAAVSATAVSAQTTEDPYADPANPALPPSNMELDLSRTALVVTDPQIDFLHPEGLPGVWLGRLSQEMARLQISKICSRPQNSGT